MSDDLTELSLQMAVLKAAKEQKEREIELINAEMGRIGQLIYDGFADSGLESLKLSGRSFKDGRDRIIKPDLDYKTSIVRIPEFYTRLRSQGEGSLIKETIHHATLGKWVRERKEQNLELPPEDELRVFTVYGANVRRAPQ